MDSNLMSCPRCGHVVGNAAGACTYCGALISEGGRKEQTDDKIAAQETPATEPALPSQPTQALLIDEMSDEADNSIKSSESSLEQQTAAEPAAAPPDPATEAELPADADAADEIGPLAKDLTVTPDQEIIQQSAVSESDAEIAVIEAQEPEAVAFSEPAAAADFMQDDEASTAGKNRSAGGADQTVEEQAQAEFEAEHVPVSSESKILDSAAEETDESETPGVETAAMLEPHAAGDQADRSTVSAGWPFSDEGMGAAQNDHQVEWQPTEEKQIAAEPESGLTSESLGDTILLEPADEVQTPAKKTSDRVVKKAKKVAPKPAGVAKGGSGAKAKENKMRADVLKIEKAARDMAAAIEKQKEKLIEAENSTNKKAEAARIQALKMQKAALAKAQAQKKQKLLLAKAAALKRKKAAEAKAQALKKQSEAQSAIETPKNEKAAAQGHRQADKPTVISGSMEVNSRMQDLLKKYEGQAIGINYDNSTEIKEALLEDANSEYFSVFVRDKKLHYNYPLKTILTVIEGQDGVDTGNSKQPTKFKAVVKVYPLVLF